VVAGDLVFFGKGNGKFRAVDARTGANLFVFDAPANIPNAGGAAAGPIAYLADGREFIVNAFGGNVPDRIITSDIRVTIQLEILLSLSHFQGSEKKSR
jgi:outer membrane protein assembly factor BamB